MSIEEKLATLSLGDESSLAATVKSDGIEKSGLAPSIEGLAAKCGSGDEKEALAGMALARSLASDCPEAQALTKLCLGPCLEQASSKSKSVREAASSTSLAICAGTNPFGVKSLLPVLFAALPVEKKWQIRELALRCVASLGETAPKQLGNALPEVVPEVTACMWDTKKQIKQAATAAMREALKVIGNKDIEHMTEKILIAISKPKEVPEIMHEMAGVTFVQVRRRRPARGWK